MLRTVGWPALVAVGVVVLVLLAPVRSVDRLRAHARLRSRPD